jgi:hypothetical protein
MNWCPEEDSNLHALQRWYLKPVRLPIPPSGHWGRFRLGRGRRQRGKWGRREKSAWGDSGVLARWAARAVGGGDVGTDAIRVPYAQHTQNIRHFPLPRAPCGIIQAADFV